MKLPIFWLMTVFVCAGVGLSGCQQATSGGSGGGSSSGPIQGTINSQNFTTVLAVATASKSVTNGYDIVLTGTATTPTVFFSVGPQPQTYTVTTFGVNGLSVMAYIGGFNFISFDSGTVMITKVDITAKQITGQFSSVATTDKLSSLSGTFTATIQ
jgi:hypothetical protein